MDMHAMSAGIEKFYSLTQFLTVALTFLCQAALAAAIVRCAAYGRRGEPTARRGLLLGFLLLWCASEMLGAVAPSAAHLRWYLIAGSVLSLMPALVFAAGARMDGRLPSLLLYPLLFMALLAAAVGADLAARAMLAPQGLFAVPVARPLSWVLPAAAVGLAACAAVANVAVHECTPRMAAGILTAYGSFLASRLIAVPLPVDVFILGLPLSVGLIVTGAEVPTERLLTLGEAAEVMRCLPERFMVFDAGLRRAGSNGGVLAELVEDCQTLGEVLDRLRSVSTRWTLDDLDSWSLVDPALGPVYYEGELSLRGPDGDRDYRIGLGPARTPGRPPGCVLSLQDISSRRAEARAVERAYADLRAVRDRLEHYAASTLPREVARDNQERAEILRERTRQRLLAGAAAVNGLRAGRARPERIAAVAEELRACLSDVRETVGRMRSTQ
jgi:hypothetical protein